MSNRGQVWDHKSLLKPKSFSKSPLDRILVPDYKFMVAIIDRIVSCSIFRKICIFQEKKIQSYSYYPRLSHILSLKCLRIFIVNPPRTIWIIRKGCGWCELNCNVDFWCFRVKNFETNRMRQNEIIDSFYCLDRLEIQSVQL